MQDECLPSALRAAAMRQSHKTYVELLGFISEHGEYPRTQRLLHSNDLSCLHRHIPLHHGVH
jgi:hypothetical protein